MYFQIDNTPEHIRKARRVENVRKEAPQEECPRLILAPFSRPPQVLFENVLIGTSCERSLEVFNPSKNTQQVTLAKDLPHGLEIHLPGDWLVLEPETCYCLTMSWTPLQPIALRETIHFTTEKRGRYDVIIVFKSAMNIKGKNQPKQGKKKNPLKKSPVAIHKKKDEVIFRTTTVKKVVQMELEQFKKYKSSNKENISEAHEYSVDSEQTNQCPFTSLNSIDIRVDTSEFFLNMKRPREILQQTYDKSTYMNDTNDLPIPRNVLKPSNRQLSPGGDIFDNLTFTPLKSVPQKKEKLDHGPKIIVSMNSDCDEDSLDSKENEENGPQSIIYVTSSQPNKWISVNTVKSPSNSKYSMKPTVQDKKIPSTSSPKDLNSPNFSINTDFSRISDLSFCPQRFSTERKVVPKAYETHNWVDDFNARPSSDTFTKESPNAPVDYQMYFMKEQSSSKCRQSLFREYNMRNDIDKNRLQAYKHEPNVWRSEPRMLTKPQSPPRSVTPPLQSIPEESNQNSHTHVSSEMDRQNTFTINRTFDTTHNKTSMSSTKQTWSKRDLRADPTLWKVPILKPEKPSRPRPSLKKNDVSMNRPSNTTFECNKSRNQNISLNLIGNVYSQSHTVDPFLSSTYFYDEEAVAKFEMEFKRWLNYILTPPADLDCNIEHKIDVGKAWIENRNKDVPLAPTREQVSSAYHNSHRLISLRRSAKALLLSPEICQVFQKLNVQIEKKLIVIRTEKNLHLDIGLQKLIMELLLCYNPLWLRIGLEALYHTVLPLKSNNDIDGMTTFIIQRMFKNPFLKNKQSKSSAPNMLQPAYMEAIKKFTLKKFFMLIFFLDQAKQKKLIPHDPCLFRRNAICKESREIVIRFTRELIAGIGDITKHLRPLGYVVCHKQTYLDEYIYAVHNIAVDIRDGVRLTKVMEIILMKNGLLNQLRTPAISRLQKIHNVQVALNALKEANFVIVGDITATDIADGHREKTMSLLWQLIHVFRAPLFETAANVIQTWWKKKYKVIVEKRQEEEKLRLKLDNAARTIQYWWQRIQYNRLVERQMQLYTESTITIQKYCRRWICRRRLLIMKTSVRKIEEWYIRMTKIREAKMILEKLRSEREELRIKSAIEIQRNFRRWRCVVKYQQTLKKIVLIQSLVRRFLARKSYLELRKSVVFIQQKYRSKLLTRKQVKLFTLQRCSAVVIQKQYRMIRQYRMYQKLKLAVMTIEKYYKALTIMRQKRQEYMQLKKSVIILQALFRSKRVRTTYTKQKCLLVNLQRKIKAHQLMKKEKLQFIKMKSAARVIQNHFRSYLETKRTRQVYVTQRQSAIVIQRRFRAYLQGKTERNNYIRMRNSAIILQRRYISLIVMRQEHVAFIKLKTTVIRIQKYYRALLLMRKCREDYQKLREAIVLIQQKYRARMQMKFEMSKYLELKNSCMKIQNFYRAVIIARQQRKLFLSQKAAAIKIQTWFRDCKKGKAIQQQYQQAKQACVTIQRIYRSYLITKKQRTEYIRIRTATICIQKYYRSYIEMKSVRQQFIKLKTASITIQRCYRGHLETKKQRDDYIRIKNAATIIQNFYRRYKDATLIRDKYRALRAYAIYVQRRYKSILAMRKAQNDYSNLKKSAIILQRRYRALVEGRRERAAYLKLKSAAVVVQTRYRASLAMRSDRQAFCTVMKSVIYIQRFYRARLEGRKQRNHYVKLRQSAITLQRQYRALSSMRNCRSSYLSKKSAALCIQNRYRARCLMIQEKTRYTKILQATIKIQRYFRAFVAGKRQQIYYLTLKSAAIKVQRWYRSIRETRKVRYHYLKLKTNCITIQRRFRALKIVRQLRCELAAKKIQIWYRSVRERNKCRSEFLKITRNITLIQSQYRMRIARKRFIALKNCAISIQRFYRAYRLGRIAREEYTRRISATIKLQSYVRKVIARRRYLNFLREMRNKRRESAAVCMQKNIRRYLVRSRYLDYRNRVVFVQRLWRGKLLTRSLHGEFMRKKIFVTKLQAVVRGYLVRKKVESKKENLMKVKEEQRRHWAASKIQALFRGHRTRVNTAMYNHNVVELRRRWREGALRSTQDTLQERNEEAMDVLNNLYDMGSVIRAFKSLDLLTEVFPMMYNETARTVVGHVYKYMSVMNRSVSSVDVLKLAASVLANLTRYRVTGPKIYAREHIEPILKYMWRFSSNEIELFLILCTYIWLFSKYDGVREDLSEYLRLPENHKMLLAIKSKVDRVSRMAQNANKHKPSSSNKHNLSASFSSHGSDLLPALEPDYGITRVNHRRYFVDTQHAMRCLFRAYKL